MFFQAGLAFTPSAHSPELIVAPLSNGKKPGPRSTRVLQRVRDEYLVLQTP